MKLHAIKETTFFQIIKFIYFFVFLIISFFILFLSPSLEYMCKKNFMFPNITLLLFDVLIFSIIFIIWRKYGKCFFGFIDKHGTKFILACSIILFLGQVYVSYNIYFLTGWDAGGHIIPAARARASGTSLDIFNLYFSRYTNNILLVWIFSIIISINTKLGIFGMGNDLMLIIIINCFISSLSSILTYKCVEKLIDKKWAIFSWIVYVLLIGTSPWLVITYSDSFALFLPILIFFLYTRDLTGKLNLLKWFLIGIISFLGYHIKPQVIIILIAIIIIEMYRFVFLTNAEKKKKGFILVALIFAFVLSSACYKTIYNKTGFNIDKEKTFGIAHFVMMGLDPERDGVYSSRDVAYSDSFTTSSERKKANIKVIKERLNNFGILGYGKFLTKKTLVNYGDGTFAWGVEGNFYMETYPDKNAWISPILKSFYYNNGDNYNKTSTFEQAVWIGVIISMLGLIFTKKHGLDNKIAVLMLSILGITTFELLFEARARYLYIYAPIYISLGILGLKNLTFKLTRLKENICLSGKIRKNI